MNSLLKEYANSVAGYIVSDQEAADFIRELLEYERQISSEISVEGFREENVARKDAGVSDFD